MAVQKRTFLILAVIATILLGAGVAFLAWRVSQPTGYVPDPSLAADNCCNTEWGSCAADDTNAWIVGFNACNDKLCDICKGATAGSCDNDGSCENGEDATSCPGDCDTGGSCNPETSNCGSAGQGCCLDSGCNYYCNSPAARVGATTPGGGSCSCVVDETPEEPPPPPSSSGGSSGGSACNNNGDCESPWPTCTNGVCTGACNGTAFDTCNPPVVSTNQVTCAQAAIAQGCYETGGFGGSCPNGTFFTCERDTEAEVLEAFNSTTNNNCNENGVPSTNPNQRPASPFCGFWQVDCDGGFNGGFDTSGCGEDVTPPPPPPPPSSSSTSSSTSSNSTSSSGEPSGLAYCVSLDDSATADGRHIFAVTQGDDLTVTLYTETATSGGGSVTNYDYNAVEGSITPSGNSSSTSTAWTVTGAQTSALSEGLHDAVEVVVTDNNASDSGGFGSNCAVQLYVTAEEVPPGEPFWVINKTGGELCLEEGESARIDYTITVSNIGDTAGTIDEVVDTLDSEISESMISNINPTEGDFDDSTNILTWDGDGSGYTFDPGEEMQFTYSVTFSSAQFGTYDNSVDIVTSEGNNPEEASFTVNVNCTLPETAIEPDQVATIVVVLGAISLLFLATMEVNYGFVSRKLKMNYVEGLNEGDFRGSVYKNKKKK